MRGLQLFNTGNLMNIREGNIKSTVRVQAPSLADITIDGILEGKQKITLLSKSQSGKVRIPVGTTAVVELIKRDKPGGEYVAITNKGLSNVEDVDLARVIKDLGTMVYKTRPEARGKKEPLSFTYRGKKFWTFSWNLVNFVNGKQDFYILRYNTNIEGEESIVDPTADYNISERTVEELKELIEDAVQREEFELAAQLTNEVNSRSETKEVVEEGKEKVETKPKLYTLDTAVKEEMEKRALEGMSWEEALRTPITYTDANNKKVTTTLKERVKQKQMQELGDFTNLLYEQNVMASLPLDVREGLIDVDTGNAGGVTYSTNQETDYLEKLYNIKHGNKEYNLAQLLFNL